MTALFTAQVLSLIGAFWYFMFVVVKKLRMQSRRLLGLLYAIPSETIKEYKELHQLMESGGALLRVGTLTLS
jgi:hypothetical protein